MLNLGRSVYRYQPDTDRDLPVIVAIQVVPRKSTRVMASASCSNIAVEGLWLES